MAADPRHVREALRRTETQLQKLVEPTERQLHDAARALAATEDRLRATHVALVKQLAFWRDLLYECEHAVDEDGGQPDCSALYRRCAMIEGQIDRLRRLQTELEQTTAQYDKAAAEVRRAIHDDVPAAIHWLHDRDTALARFDDSGSIGALVAAAGGSQAEKLVTLGRAALASGNPVLLTIFAAAFDGMGTHGAKYNAARQSFLRSLANDPKQPRHVRGWVRQEINRINQVDRAISEGRRPPGRASRQIKGIPGYDVGHRFPGLDLPANFRLEDRATNRRRPIIARRLGIDHLYR